MMLPRAASNAVRTIAFLAAAAVRTTAAADDTWPAKPVRVVVPLAAGSTADIVARLMGQELSKALHQAVVIENRAGAGGTIGMGEVARAAPDGYNVSFTGQGTLVFNRAIYPKLPYDTLKDFTALALVGGVANVMIVHPGNPAANVTDVIAQARARPGQLTYSSGGSGTSHHLSGVLFARMTRTDLIHVPYKSTPQGVLAVMASDVTMGFFNTPTVISQIRDGKLKALGVTSTARSPLLPAVPTMEEQGLKGFEVNTWFGFVGPAGLPREIVMRYNTEINKIAAAPEMRARLSGQGFDLAPPMDAPAFTKFIAEDAARWVPIVKASGATAE